MTRLLSLLDQEWLQITQDCIMHGLLKTWARGARGCGQFVEDAAEDQQSYLCVVIAFGAWHGGLCAVEALCDEVYEDLA